MSIEFENDVNSKNKPASMYDLLAPNFREISDARRNWISAIDKHIVKQLNPEDILLDVGAGDGVRARRIADVSGINKVTLVEPSSEMCKMAKEIPNSKVIQANTADLSELDLGKFDVILCLWNVLGHVPTFEDRVNSVKNMIKLLDKDGKLYIDVNNRYNINAYGKKALLNIFNDLTNPSEVTGKNGDVSFEMTSGKGKIDASGHLFTLNEVRLIVKASSANLREMLYFHYDTGEQVKTQFEGQIFITLQKK